VIPTRLGWENLARTLPSLLGTMSDDDEVVVVGDRCDPRLPEPRDARCRVVAHAGVPGFAPACNRGVREARGALILILNDDVVVGPGVLQRLEEALSRPGVGAVGPNVVSEPLGRSESRTVLVWHHGVLEAHQEALAGQGTYSVPYLCGAALALRRDDFVRLGGFDERLAPYFWEDLDLSLRLRDQVGDTVALGEVAVSHRHGATVSREPEKHRRAIYERNRLLVTWRRLRGWRWVPHLAWTPVRLAAGLLREREVPAGFVQALARLVAGKGGDARRD
jgi:GT2 family glycosyltransferase